MPRVARIVIPNCPHHVTQRGNNRQDVFFVDDDWKQTLREMLGEATLSVVRLSTHRGRPLGSDRFLSKIESLVGRRLRPLPVGRPRKRRGK